MENYSLADIAAASGVDNGFGGSGAWVLIILFALIFGNNGFFGNNGQNATQGDIQRAVDLNSIQTGQANISADIQRGIYEINNNTSHSAYDNLGEIRDVQASVATNGANIINALTSLQSNMQNCCCETKQTVMENRYLDAQNTANIIAASTANSQKILDALAQNKIDALQAQVSELKTQNMFCGIPKINPYGYGVYPYAGVPNGAFNAI